jgi:hypothetical protein
MASAVPHEPAPSIATESASVPFMSNLALLVGYAGLLLIAGL